MEEDLRGRSCCPTSALFQLGQECVSVLGGWGSQDQDELYLGSSSGSSLALCSRKGQLKGGWETPTRKPSQSQSIQTTMVQQGMFISFLQMLSSSHLTFQFLVTVRVMFLCVFPPVAATGAALTLLWPGYASEQQNWLLEHHCQNETLNICANGSLHISSGAGRKRVG